MISAGKNWLFLLFYQYGYFIYTSYIIQLNLFSNITKKKPMFPNVFTLSMAC